MAESNYNSEADVKAHELAHSHGRNAHLYAARLAAEAMAEGMKEEAEFWKSVEMLLKPRGISN
jgi:hypothetical protein